MKRWDNKVKFQVVLEGLRGKPVAEICTQYQIHQAQYYKWRDEFFQYGPEIFERKKKTSREFILEEQLRMAKDLIADMQLELKKTANLSGNGRKTGH